MRYIKLALMVGVLALIATPVEANGVSKRKSYAPKRQVVRVYEPRDVVRVYEPRPAAPLVSLGVLGTNVIVWDDLDLDLYDDSDPLPPRIRRLRYYEYRALRARRY